MNTELGIKKPKIAFAIDKAKWADPIAEVAQELFLRWVPKLSESGVMASAQVFLQSCQPLKDRALR
ncbi:MAG: hypothetical protein R2875_14305 [Desulfobacterales bacterium]